MLLPLATDSTDFALGSIGLVELASSYLNDRQKRFWSKAELIVYLNAEQDTLAAYINGLCKKYFLTSATTPAVANQSVYSFPTDLVRLFGIEAGDSASDTDPQPIVEVPLNDREFYQRLDAANTKRDLGYFFIAGTTFQMLPPTAASAGVIRLHYVKRLDALEDNEDVSAIPAQHHELLAVGAARRALMKKERINVALEKRYAEGIAAMEGEITQFSVPQLEQVESWWGSFGPDSVLPIGDY